MRCTHCRSTRRPKNPPGTGALYGSLEGGRIVRGASIPVSTLPHFTGVLLAWLAKPFRFCDSMAGIPSRAREGVLRRPALSSRAAPPVGCRQPDPVETGQAWPAWGGWSTVRRLVRRHGRLSVVDVHHHCSTPRRRCRLLLYSGQRVLLYGGWLRTAPRLCLRPVVWATVRRTWSVGGSSRGSPAAPGRSAAGLLVCMGGQRGQEAFARTGRPHKDAGLRMAISWLPSTGATPSTSAAEASLLRTSDTSFREDLLSATMNSSASGSIEACDRGRGPGVVASPVAPAAAV